MIPWTAGDFRDDLYSSLPFTPTKITSTQNTKRKALVRPIFKKTERSKKENYTPVSILNKMSKII